MFAATRIARQLGSSCRFRTYIDRWSKRPYILLSYEHALCALLFLQQILLIWGYGKQKKVRMQKQKDGETRRVGK